MKREDLAASLAQVMPAVSIKNIVPAFSHVCFTGKRLLTYNDIVGLSTPFTSEFKGGVKGNLLFSMVKTSSVEEVDFLQEDEQLIIKAGRSKLTCTALLPGEFIFSMPSVKGATKVAYPEKLLGAMNHVALTLGYDPGFPTTMGITIIPGKKGTYLCSADSNAAITRVFMSDADFAKALPGPILFPPQMCEFFMKIAAKDYPQYFYISEDWVLVTFASGLRLFSRLGEEIDPDLFQGAMKSHYMPNKEKFVAIPDSFSGAIERAIAVLSDTKEKVANISVRKATLRVGATSTQGSLFDTAKLSGHQDIKVRVDLDRVKAALALTDKIFITDDALLLKKGALIHLIATHTDVEEEGNAS